MMKKTWSRLFILVAFIQVCHQINAISAVTYDQPHTRLGDQLFSYCKAKWVSYNHDIPLFFKKFKYSDQMVLNKEEIEYVESTLQSLIKVNLSIVGGKDHQHNGFDCLFDEQNRLYIVDMYYLEKSWLRFENEIESKLIFPYKITYDKTYFESGINRYQIKYDLALHVFKKDPGFIATLRKLIKPLKELSVLKKPANMISVALHVRKGGGFDLPYKSIQQYDAQIDTSRYIDFLNAQVDKTEIKLYSETLKIHRLIRTSSIAKVAPADYTYNKDYIDLLRPLKHPPDQFYIDQLKALKSIVGDTPLYVYIFTDDQDPASIAKKYKKALGFSDLIFDYRKNFNSYYSNVLDDLFLMSQFDCLIRPYSSFSVIAELLGNHKVIISPYHGIWHKGSLIIDEVLYKQRESMSPVTRE